MSKRSEAVKKWRKNCKDRIVQAFGGKCCVCGYDKCNESLALHHLDPLAKDFSLGAIRASPKNWDTIVLELRKCILVCHNCHTEIHSNITSVPIDPPRFNESFADYKILAKVLTPCLTCGQLKSEHLKFCSTKCYRAHPQKIDWDKIDLITELKFKPVIKLADELGCADATIHKRLKKLGLTLSIIKSTKNN